MYSVSTFKKENISTEVMCSILLLFLNTIPHKLKNIHKEKNDLFKTQNPNISISYNNLNKNAYFLKKIVIKNAHNALRFLEAIYS